MAIQPGYALPALAPTSFFSPNQPGEELREIDAPPNAYIMRAYKTTATVGHVYWISLDEPDLVGDFSGYPPIDLIEIVIVREPCP